MRVPFGRVGRPPGGSIFGSLDWVSTEVEWSVPRAVRVGSLGLPPLFRARLSARVQRSPLRRRSPVRAVHCIGDLAVTHRGLPLLGFIRAPAPASCHCIRCSPSEPKLFRRFGLPHPNAFRPRRSSRPRRFPPQPAEPQAVRPLTRRRFVAPCSRSWGSPCFQRPLRPLHRFDPKTAATPSPVPSLSRWRSPFEAFPSLAAWPSSPRRSPCEGLRVHRRSCPLVVVPVRSFRVATVRPVRSSTSGLCSTRESVAIVVTLPSDDARCSHGFWWDWDPA